MRSPLHVTLAHLEMMREDASGEQAEHIEGAIGGATAISRMATNLLDVSRLEAGRLPVHRSRVDLAILANEVVESFRVLQPSRGIVVLGSSEAVAHCDLELTRRIMENLISNAIHYNRSGGEVRVSVNREGDASVLRVSDTGLGIDSEDLPHIFERFYRADKSRSRAQGRTGLGLAITKAIVEAHGGTIVVESQFGKGSTFIVRLPQCSPP